MGFIVGQAVEYGFAYNGTRLVSRAREDNNYLSSFLSSVLLSQTIVFFICLVFIILLRIFFDLFDDNVLLIFTLLASFFQSVSLNWFLRGIGKTALVAKLEILSKAIALVMLFILVKDEDDTAFVMLAFLVGNLIAFATSLCLVASIVSIKLASIKDAVKVITEGWNSFLVRAGGSILGDGNVMVASLILQPAIFGLFAGIYRIVSAIRGLFVPLIDALFPYFSKKQSNRDLDKMVKDFLPVLIGIGLSLSLIIFLFAETLIKVLLGDEFISGVYALQVFSTLPFAIAIIHGFGTQWLLALGKEKIYSRIVILAGLVGLCVNYLLTPKFGIYGAVAANLTSYTLIALLLSVIFLSRRRIGL